MSRNDKFDNMNDDQLVAEIVAYLKDPSQFIVKSFTTNDGREMKGRESVIPDELYSKIKSIGWLKDEAKIAKSYGFTFKENQGMASVTTYRSENQIGVVKKQWQTGGGVKQNLRVSAMESAIDLLKIKARAFDGSENLVEMAIEHAQKILTWLEKEGDNQKKEDNTAPVQQRPKEEPKNTDFEDDIPF